MITLAVPREQRLVLSGVSWERYEGLLRDFEGRHIRLTYSQGDLEIMTVSSKHERCKSLAARLFEVLTEELDIPVLSLGNTTYKREDLARGLEPDECWYIKHEALMREKEEIDLNIDPPPELVIEVEISRSVINRLEIYARLGVPEIWRYDGETLRVCVLTDGGNYVDVDRSATLPQVPLDGLARFLALRGEMDETSLVKSFRAWVRANIVK